MPSVVPDMLPPRDTEALLDWSAPTAGWAMPRSSSRGRSTSASATAVLEDEYESMRSWVDLTAALAGPSRVWRDGFQWGDWLDPAAPADRPNSARHSSLVATARFHARRSCSRTAPRCSAMPRTRSGIGRWPPRAVPASSTSMCSPMARSPQFPTAYALALEFRLLREEGLRATAGGRLAELVEEDGYRIGTGFLGTPLVCDALTSVGEHEAAYRLLMQRECPSWLYPVTMGATTIWERWDSLLPDGTMNSDGMRRSTAPRRWGRRLAASHRGRLAPAEPGYRMLRIRPLPGGGLAPARARRIAPYGEAISGLAHRERDVPPRRHRSSWYGSAGDASRRHHELAVGPGTHSWAVVFPESTSEAR